MTLRLTKVAAEVVATQHDKAADRIDRSAARAPSAPDAGIATDYLSDIVAAVSETAAEIAVLNLGIAEQVRDAADDLGATEQQVGEELRRLQGLVR